MSPSHRTCLTMLSLIAATVSIAPANAAAPSAPAAHPNVLFIALDDLNHWVGHLDRNKQTKTPNIDRLARMGTTFTHAYCAAPVCNPSRAALMTGLRPGASGVYNNSNDWRPIVPPELTLVTTLRKSGYYACGAGKIYHGSFDRHSEWDDYLASKGDPKSREGVKAGPLNAFGPVDAPEADWADHKSVDYGLSQLNKKHDKPFFVAVGLHKPHMAWNVPRKYYEMHPLASIELPPYREDDLDDLPPEGREMAKPREHDAIVTAGKWREAVQGYLAAVSYADAEVGRLLDGLEKSAYAKNTIIVLWGDHGWHLGEKHHWRKFALWEESTRAPFIWVVPGLTQAGTRSERTVDFMSIYPTLCDLCGVAVPAHVQGQSIRPLLVNPSAEWNRPAITTWGRQNHAVRSAGWRYIRYAGGGEELYDEANDPYEWKNLANDPAYAARKSELAKWLPSENKPTAGKEKGRGKNKADDE